MNKFNHWEKDGHQYLCPACDFSVPTTKAVINTYMFCPGCGKQMIGDREETHSVQLEQPSPMPAQFTKPVIKQKPARSPRRQSRRSLDDIPINIGDFSPDAYQFVPALDDESDVTSDY